MRAFAGLGLLLFLSCVAAKAQDISGTWQATDHGQHVLKIRKSRSGWRGEFYNLGDEASGAPRNGNPVYGPVSVPVLALLAMPRRCQPNCDKPFMQKIMAADQARADAFEKGNPRAHVVRIAGASHFIWRSNPADVEREMNAFMDGLH